MRYGKRFNIATILTVFGIAAFAGPAAAVPVVYSGYDAGSTSLAASPNATAAAAAFDLATGPISIIDFESAVPADVSISGGSIGNASDTGVCATPDLHCYATSPVNVYRNNGASFSFATPIDSFGAYFTGWQLSGQTLNIGYMDGSSEVLNMPAGIYASGGTLFFGFTDIGAAITSIDYIAGTDANTDAIGFDDVRYGNAGYTPAPEPSTLMLLGTGLLVVARSRRKQKA